VEANVAALLAGAGRKLDSDVLGTTALGVLNDRAARLAGSGLLADRAVRHAVVDFDVGVHVGRDVHLGDGELLVPVTREAGSGALGGLALDGFVLGGALAPGVTLAELVGAREAREAKAVVRADWAGGEVGPVEAALLSVVALVVTVGGALELRRHVPSLDTSQRRCSASAMSTGVFLTAAAWAARKAAATAEVVFILD